MILDLVIAAVILWGAWGGYRSGLIAMLLSVVILIAAAVVASMFSTQAGHLLRIGEPFLRPVIGFFFLFIILLIAGSFVKRAVRPKAGLSKGLDRGLGAVLGGLRTAIVLSFMLVLLHLVSLPPAATAAQSKLYQPILDLSTVVVKILKPITSGGVVRPLGTTIDSLSHPSR